MRVHLPSEDLYPRPEDIFPVDGIMDVPRFDDPMFRVCNLVGNSSFLGCRVMLFTTPLKNSFIFALIVFYFLFSFIFILFALLFPKTYVNRIPYPIPQSISHNPKLTFQLMLFFFAFFSTGSTFS